MSIIRNIRNRRRLNQAQKDIDAMKTSRDVPSVPGVVLGKTFAPPSTRLQRHAMFESYTPASNITWVRVKRSAKS